MEYSNLSKCYSKDAGHVICICKGGRCAFAINSGIQQSSNQKKCYSKDVGHVICILVEETGQYICREI